MDVSLLPKNVKVWNYRQISRFFKYGGGLGNRMSPNSPDLGYLAEILQILAINASSLFFAAAKWWSNKTMPLMSFLPHGANILFFRDKFFLLLMVGNNKYTSYWGIRGGKKVGEEGEGEVEKEKEWSWKMYEREGRRINVKAKKSGPGAFAKEWTDNEKIRPGENHSDLLEILVRMCTRYRCSHEVCLIASIQIGSTVVQSSDHTEK